MDLLHLSGLTQNEALKLDEEINERKKGTVSQFHTVQRSSEGLEKQKKKMVKSLSLGELTILLKERKVCLDLSSVCFIFFCVE